MSTTSIVNGNSSWQLDVTTVTGQIHLDRYCCVGFQNPMETRPPVSISGITCDTTSFRTGAGSKDNIGDIIDDMSMGIDFLDAFEPTIFFNGNHDIRIWESLNDTQRPTSVRRTGDY